MEILNYTPFNIEALPFKGPDKKAFISVIVKGTFDFCHKKPAPLSDNQIPIAFGDEFYDEDGGSIKFESDIAPFKPRADIVLVGKAYASPDNPSVTFLDVSLRVGKIHKPLQIIGDRQWIFSEPNKPGQWSEALPFKTMPVVYEKAFGGMDTNTGEFCAENLVGTGFMSKNFKEIPENMMLPNIENPHHLLRSWEDPPKPAGFGFISRAWMPRAQYAGTYDKIWRKKRSPDLPQDFRFDYYNAAHPDLQTEYLKGCEEIELVNLTPEGREHFYLPGINLTAAVRRFDENKKDSRQIENINLNLDTLCLLPDERKFYLIWRGCCHVNDIDAFEIDKIEIIEKLS